MIKSVRLSLVIIKKVIVGKVEGGEDFYLLFLSLYNYSYSAYFSNNNRYLEFVFVSVLAFTVVIEITNSIPTKSITANCFWQVKIV